MRLGHVTGVGLLASLWVVGTPAWAAEAVEVARVVVDSEPRGAAVYLDGTEVGVTPVELSDLDPGDHRLRLAKNGFLDHGRLVRVEKGQSLELRLKLTPLPSEAAGASPPGSAASDASKKSKGGRLKWVLAGTGVAVAGGTTYLLLRNDPPTIGVTFAPAETGIAGLTNFEFRVHEAKDPNGDPLTITWDFGDGSRGEGITARHIYQKAQTYEVVLTVSDGKKQASARFSVVVRDLSGEWKGSVASINFTMSLTHNGNALTGNYSDRDGAGTISGTLSDPRSVEIKVTQHQVSNFPITFKGIVDADVNKITGAALGAPFTMTR